MKRTDPPYSFSDLVELMRTLRGPGGCPWDREQSPESLQPYLLEEAYEVLEALDRGEPEEICEELGDLLLQVVFLAQIFTEQGQFNIDDVADSITAKLIRRHPHVFEGSSFDSLEDLNQQWAQIKKKEQREKKSDATGTEAPTDNVPPQLPALMRARKLIERNKITLDPQMIDDLKVMLAPGEVASSEENEIKIAQGICHLVALGNRLGIDCEQSLRKYLSEHS